MRLGDSFESFHILLFQRIKHSLLNSKGSQKACGANRHMQAKPLGTQNKTKEKEMKKKKKKQLPKAMNFFEKQNFYRIEL